MARKLGEDDISRGDSRRRFLMVHGERIVAAQRTRGGQTASHSETGLYPPSPRPSSLMGKTAINLG